MKRIFSLIVALFLLITVNSVFASSGEIIMGNTSKMSYIYYYGQGCSHCANVDKYMRAVDGYEKLNVEKFEIYFDDDNREKYLETGERLGISEADLGIPFLIINNGGKEDFLIGDETIINHFKSFLGEAPENSNKTIVLIILGLLVILIPVFIIKSSK